MSDVDAELAAARRARAGDALTAASVQREQEAERQVTAAEARSLGKLARDVLGPVLGAIKRALGWP